jgi:hypothetical protein
MNPKRKNTQIHKLFCLSNLFLENVDELKPTTPRMVKLKSDLIDFCEELNNSVANTATVQKSTYFSEISHKIDTILRKEFNPEM